MKFPKESNIKGTDYRDNSPSDRLIKAWGAAAIRAGLETGIFVDVNFDYFQGNYPYIERIYFKVFDQEAEDETTLRRILKLKAFV